MTKLQNSNKWYVCGESYERSVIPVELFCQATEKHGGS